MLDKKLKTALYLDDCRTPTTQIPGYEKWDVVRNYTEFKEYIDKNGLPDMISFDHDLAEEHMNDYFNQLSKKGFQSPNYDDYKEKTGLDCAKYVCDQYSYKIVGKEEIDFPRCVVHSHNPVGSDNIKSYINQFKKHCRLTPDCYSQKFPFEIKQENRY